MKTIFLICILSCFVIAESIGVSSLLHKRYTSPCDGHQIYTATEQCYGELMALSEIPIRANDEQLQNVKAMCSTLKTSNGCFVKKMRPCGDAGETMAQMLANVFRFVCSRESVDVLTSSGECWAHETLKEDIGRCTEEMEEGFRTQGFHGWCDVTNEYIGCIGSKVRQKTVCSHEAALFMQEMVRRSIQPAADRMRCRLRDRAVRDLASILLRR